jgi:hypothetical protein
LIVGDFRLRDVSFIVLPDKNEPWVHLPQGRRGLLGVPVLIAFRTLTWSQDGVLELGAKPWTAKQEIPNLLFIDDHLAVRAIVEDSKYRELWTPERKPQISTLL